MLDKIINYICNRFGFKTGIKRNIVIEDDDDISEPNPKQRRIETTKEQRFFTSDQFLCPPSNWGMPKKRPVISCRQQQRSVDALQRAVRLDAPQPGRSWFDEQKENIIEVSDDEDPDVLGVWQDANTLRERPVFKLGNDMKSTEGAASSLLMDKPDDDDDVQVVKVLESHSHEIAQSGNTISIFQTPSSRVPSLTRHFGMDSANSRKSKVLLQRLKSSHSKFSQDGNGSQSGTSFRFSRTEERKPKLALNESFQLQEKKKYSELLQHCTSVPIQGRSRHHRGIWPPSLRSVPERGRSSLYSDFAGRAREKISKEGPILIDLTRPQFCRSLSGTRLEVRRDREAEPYTSTTKQDDEDEPQAVESSFSRINSLADALKSNYVHSEDLLTSINEKYEKKREARERQEEKEKLKITHFQKREKKLQVEALERLTNYLKITDAILDDVVIIEEKVTLPELTPEMQVVIDAALIPRPPNEVLVEAFGLTIKRRDMETLAGLNWLNDEVINFYMELLKERGKLENYRSVYSFNTFFYPRLLSGGHSALKRWTRKVDIFAHDLIIVPVHLGVHWCMAAIDFHNRTIKYYDSMGSPNNKCLQNLLKYLQDESLDKKKKSFDTSQWQAQNVQKIPHQMNGSDCGMFSCMYAEFICRNADITFTQQDMPYFRRKMVFEIYKRKLLM